MDVEVSQFHLNSNESEAMDLSLEEYLKDHKCKHFMDLGFLVDENYKVRRYKRCVDCGLIVEVNNQW